MDRIGKELVVGGLVLALAGGVFGKINGNSARGLENNTVREMKMESNRAANAQGMLPLLSDRLVRQGYISQCRRSDYSESAAHNPDFQAFEKAEADMKIGWARSNQLAGKPEVKPYIAASNRSFLGYLAAAAGLGLVWLGAKKEDILFNLEHGC